MKNIEKTENQIRELVERAEAVAIRLGDGHVGTNHFLIATLEKMEEYYPQEMKQLGIDWKKIKDIVPQDESKEILPKDLTYTVRMKIMLERIIDTARKCIKNPELFELRHILLVLTREEEGECVSVLRKLGIDSTKVKEIFFPGR